MRYLATLFFIALLATGGYYLYQSEAVSDLLGPPAEKPEDPLSFLTEGDPVISPKEPEKPSRSRRRRPSAARPTAAPVESPAVSGPPAVPNADVSSALLGILRARGLAYGISLSVTDDKVEVVGEVDSQDARQRILDVIEKGRGRRTLVADQLTVER